MLENNSQLTTSQKIEQNIWDSLEPVIETIALAKIGKWVWYKNSRCKYIEVRIDMRDFKCIIRDRHSVRISPVDMVRQIDDAPQAASTPQDTEPSTVELYEALVNMCSEFRAHDLTYGSRAYQQATELINGYIKQL